MNNHLQVFKDLTKRGHFADAFQLVEHLPATVTEQAEFKFEQYRAYLKQGDVKSAEATLHSISLALLSPGFQLIVLQEKAYLRILRETAFAEALAQSKELLGREQALQIKGWEIAEASRIHIRIVLTAAAYYEVSKLEAQKALHQLPGIAQSLKKHGKTEEAFAASLTYGQKVPIGEARLWLKQLEQDAVQAGEPGLAAEAMLILAERLKADDADYSEIEAALQAARQHYHNDGHQNGGWEVKRQELRLYAEQQQQIPLGLEECLNGFEVAKYYRGMLNVLMDLSSFAHKSGNLTAARSYRYKLLELSEQLGMGISVDSFITAQADLLMRNFEIGEAIELCQAALKRKLPAMSLALYEQMLASAYSFANNFEAACYHGKEALRKFETIGNEEAASDAALKCAADLCSLRQDASWEEAAQLLESWIKRDTNTERWEAVVGKLELKAQVYIQLFLFSEKERGNMELLSRGEAVIEQAEHFAQRLKGYEKEQKLANLAQLRGQYYQSRGEEAKVLQSWQKALGHYEKAGFLMEQANCHYMIGILFLNKANQYLNAYFEKSETHLLQALEYYEQSGMRNQAIDTAYMLALLYTNAAHRMTTQWRDKLLDAALQKLQFADQHTHAIRSFYRTGANIVEVQEGKRALMKKNQRVYQLALQITCQYRLQPEQAWRWAQKSKARSLSDILGIGVGLPLKIEEQLKQSDKALKLVEREQALSHQIQQSSAKDRILLKLEMDGLLNEMSTTPELTDYLELKHGQALHRQDMNEILTESEGEASKIFIDWIAVGERIYLLAFPAASTPSLYPISLSRSEVSNFVNIDLSPESFRANLKYVPDLLGRMAPLVQPLLQCSQPGDLLIFSPTGPLHRLPLHALEVEGAVLIERNPVVYTPSSTVLRYCLSRQEENEPLQSAALFGDPKGDRPAAAEIVGKLEKLFDSKAILKEKVTKRAFLQSASNAGLVHFQGHALHLPDAPLNSHLVLSDGVLAAQEIFEGLNLKARLVCLAACETATSQILRGDEPLGLIPAFLYAGAHSVLATLWKVNQHSAARFMQVFYEKMASFDNNMALAVQAATLEVRSDPKFSSPYHWAPFVLFGNWK